MRADIARRLRARQGMSGYLDLHKHPYRVVTERHEHVAAFSSLITACEHAIVRPGCKVLLPPARVPVDNEMDAEACAKYVNEARRP